jgi:RNA polymerase sigma factor (sigma-70 family)
MQPSTNPPDADLASYLRAFDAEFDYVYRALRRHGVDRTEAEDLAQEVFVVAWRRWADFDPAFPLRPWLAGIAFNVAHRHRRRRKPTLPGEVLDAPDEAPLAEQRLEAVEARALVLRALARLPERHRAVLVLHDLDGLTVEQITSVWSVGRFTVYSRLRRARIAFADEIARLEALDAPAPGIQRTTRAPALLLAWERKIPAAPQELRRRLRARLASPASASKSVARPATLSSTGKLLGGAAIVATLAGVATLILRPNRVPTSSTPTTSLSGSPPARLQPRFPARSVPELLPLPAPSDAIATPAAPVAEAALASGLVGHWTFDDAVGSRSAADRSGNNHPCRLRHADRNAAWVPGARGGAIDLGFQGWLECPQPAALPRRPMAAMTVAAWVKRGGSPIYHHAIAMRAMGSGRSNYLFFGFVGDELKVSSSGWHDHVTAPVADAPGRWMHVAFTHDDAHVVKLYVDGMVVGRSASRIRELGGADGPLIVGGGLKGGDRTKVGQHFEGALDDLRVYDRALSDDEMRALASR